MQTEKETLPSLSLSEMGVEVNKILSVWIRCTRPTVSIDADMFRMFFPFLPVAHTVHNKSTGNPVFILVNRLDAIKRVQAHYQLHEGKKLNGTL